MERWCETVLTYIQPKKSMFHKILSSEPFIEIQAEVLHFPKKKMLRLSTSRRIPRHTKTNFLDGWFLFKNGTISFYQNLPTREKISKRKTKILFKQHFTSFETVLTNEKNMCKALCTKLLNRQENNRIEVPWWETDKIIHKLPQKAWIYILAY